MCVRVSMHIYNVYMYLCTFMYAIYAYVSVYVVCFDIFNIFTDIFFFIYVHRMCKCVHIRICKYTSIYIYMHLFLRVHMYM